LPGAHFMLSCPSAVAENQPANKNRMNKELASFASRLREAILSEGQVPRGPDSNGQDGGSCNSPLRDFNQLALELFALQLKANPAYRKICAGRKLMPGAVEHWTEIPVVPTAIFKELELTSIPPAERTAVFHSSGTTEQKPSRHFHSPESLELYEASLLSWFNENVLRDLRFTNDDLRGSEPSAIFLTPPPELAPHSSLVHMFETIRQQTGGAPVLRSSSATEGGSVPASRSPFFGKVTAAGTWTLDFAAVLDALGNSTLNPQPSTVILGTAFSFVHLLDFLAENNLSFQLPPGSRVMETGGYKNRSRSMPKSELHQLITDRLGVPPSHIICEYGMSELSSQAYDSVVGRAGSPLHAERRGGDTTPCLRVFRFPPWARAQIISPETGGEVAEGETGLIRVFDLANVFSVMAIQTEDLGIHRGDGFELIGRAALAEPRGCSLMALEGSASSLPQSQRGTDKAMPSKK
jgi:hypothetical protein